MKKDKLDRKQILTVIGCVAFILLFIVSPLAVFILIAVGVVFMILRAKMKSDAQQHGSENQRRNSSALASVKQRITGEDIKLPTETENAINEMDVPLYVKSLLRRKASKCGGTLDGVLASADTPDSLRQYIRNYQANKFDESVSLHQHNDTEIDTLYNPEEYESVQEDAEYDPNLIYVNGKPMRFQNSKNPFEM